MSDQSPNNTRIGSAGGMICSIMYGIDFADIFKTIVLAIIGTVVSVTISVLLNHLLKKWRN